METTETRNAPKTVKAQVLKVEHCNSACHKVTLTWVNGKEITATVKVWSDAQFFGRLAVLAFAEAVIVDLRKEGAAKPDYFLDKWDGVPAKAEKKKGAFVPRASDGPWVLAAACARACAGLPDAAKIAGMIYERLAPLAAKSAKEINGQRAN